jgi:hypothetical protein
LFLRPDVNQTFRYSCVARSENNKIARGNPDSSIIVGVETLIVQINQIENIRFVGLSNFKHLIILSNRQLSQFVTMIIHIDFL